MPGGVGEDPITLHGVDIARSRRRNFVPGKTLIKFAQIRIAPVTPAALVMPQRPGRWLGEAAGQTQPLHQRIEIWSTHQIEFQRPCGAPK